MLTILLSSSFLFAAPAEAELDAFVERPGLALRCAKALVCPEDPDAPQVVDHATILVEDGVIVAVGPADEIEVPSEYRVVDLGDSWVLPGMIDLHSHVGGGIDWATHVYLTNTGPRISPAVIPENPLLLRGVAGGVTTILYIPGSGTNMGGQGVLLKTGFETYEEMLVRDPGSLKVAQAGNPESWGMGVGRAFMNWNTRDTFRRGLAYAAAWERYERGDGGRPRVNLQWEVFRELAAHRTQISAHTQVYQVVLATLTTVAREMGLAVYIDHGTFDGYKAAGLAAELGVPAILGPRMIAYRARAYLGPDIVLLECETDGKLEGIAERYQDAGHPMIGFNTDAIDPAIAPPIMRPGIVTTEELSLQAAMGVRYGFANERLQAVRGVTIVPALAAGIDDRVGSLEPGKDADLVVVDGDPIDPRTTVLGVYIEGRCVYDPERDGRRW